MINEKLPVNRRWVKSRSRYSYLVNFSLGKAEVKLLTTLIYRPSIEAKGGRVYRVQDIKTGRQDIVGVEYLKRNNLLLN